MIKQTWTVWPFWPGCKWDGQNCRSI